MKFSKDFEKDEVKITIGGIEYLTMLNAELEIDYTPPSGEVRASDNSCLEPPSGADIEVTWAETTLEIVNDHGEDIGTLIIKGVGFFESLVELKEDDIAFSEEDML